MLVQKLGSNAIPIILGYGIAIVVVYHVALAFYNVFFHPLRKYPGPKIAAMTQLPCAYYTIRGRQGQWIESLHKEYDAEIVRISPRELSFINASAWKDIHGGRPGRKVLEKDPAVYRNSLNSAPSLVTSSTADHRRMRRVFAHGFSEKSFRDQEPLVEEHVNTLIDSLRKQVSGPKAGRVDISEWFRWTAFDISGDLAFGESFECLKNQRMAPWASMIPGFLKADMALAAIGRFSPWKGLDKHLLSGKTKDMMASHYASTAEKLERRLKLGTDRPDYISPFIKFNEEGKTGVSRDELASAASLFIVAGSDSTATVLTGTMYYLTQHTDYLRKATQEVRSTFRSEAEITAQSVHNLPLMIACIDEASRIYPTILTGSQVITPPEGDEIGGEWIPGNTGLAINMYAAYRSEKNFRDPLSYIPERWLGDPRFEKDQRAVFNPFSYGHRNCLGKNLGILEPRLVLARLLWNFDIGLCKDLEDPEWLDQECFTTWQRKSLHITLRNKN